MTPLRRRSKTGDSLWLQRGAFITLLLIPLVIPSDWKGSKGKGVRMLSRFRHCANRGGTLAPRGPFSVEIQALGTYIPHGAPRGVAWSP